MAIINCALITLTLPRGLDETFIEVLRPPIKKFGGNEQSDPLVKLDGKDVFLQKRGALDNSLAFSPSFENAKNPRGGFHLDIPKMDDADDKLLYTTLVEALVVIRIIRRLQEESLTDIPIGPLFDKRLPLSFLQNSYLSDTVTPSTKTNVFAGKFYGRKHPKTTTNVHGYIHFRICLGFPSRLYVIEEKGRYERPESAPAHVQMTLTTNNTLTAHRPTRGVTSQVALLAAYSKADSLSTDECYLSEARIQDEVTVFELTGPSLSCSFRLRKSVAPPGWHAQRCGQRKTWQNGMKEIMESLGVIGTIASVDSGQHEGLNRLITSVHDIMQPGETTGPKILTGCSCLAQSKLRVRISPGTFRKNLPKFPPPPKRINDGIIKLPEPEINSALRKILIANVLPQIGCLLAQIPDTDDATAFNLFKLPVNMENKYSSRMQDKFVDQFCGNVGLHFVALHCLRKMWSQTENNQSRLRKLLAERTPSTRNSPNSNIEMIQNRMLAAPRVLLLDDDFLHESSLMFRGTPPAASIKDVFMTFVGIIKVLPTNFKFPQDGSTAISFGNLTQPNAYPLLATATLLAWCKISQPVTGAPISRMFHFISEGYEHGSHTFNPPPVRKNRKFTTTPVFVNCSTAYDGFHDLQLDLTPIFHRSSSKHTQMRVVRQVLTIRCSVDSSESQFNACIIYKRVQSANEDWLFFSCVSTRLGAARNIMRRSKIVVSDANETYNLQQSEYGAIAYT
ncbi:hypothetical protein CLF_109519, partial [Clonorchis sinensis]